MAPITAVGICHALGVKKPDMEECAAEVTKVLEREPLVQSAVDTCSTNVSRTPEDAAACVATEFREANGKTLEKQWPFLKREIQEKYRRFGLVPPALLAKKFVSPETTSDPNGLHERYPWHMRPSCTDPIPLIVPNKNGLVVGCGWYKNPVDGTRSEPICVMSAVMEQHF
ncbi:MAG: hypothetical protein HYV02_08560 [Deltaproteobacteria bacterium]|nr:hypothetical protein [Deltaproteobacteria bacterium]